MDPRKFWTACRVHDWFYMMAEDPGAYRDGHDNEEHLQSMANNDPALTPIFKAWEDYYRGTGQKPDEPKMGQDNAT